MKKISETIWKKKLTKEQYHILRERGTEAPWSGTYITCHKKGMYVCAACGSELFDSQTKYDSPCGWPSFFEAQEESVEFHKDHSHAMARIEVTCKKGGSHLGHVFDDGSQPTGKRFCINSVGLDFKEAKNDS